MKETPRRCVAAQQRRETAVTANRRVNGVRVPNGVTGPRPSRQPSPRRSPTQATATKVQASVAPDAANRQIRRPVLTRAVALRRV